MSGRTHSFLGRCRDDSMNCLRWIQGNPREFAGGLATGLSQQRTPVVTMTAELTDHTHAPTVTVQNKVVSLSPHGCL